VGTRAVFKYFCLVVFFGAQLLLIGSPHDQGVRERAQPDTLESIEASPRVLLLSELRTGSIFECESSGLVITNRRGASASARLKTKTCSCMRVEGIPSEIGPGNCATIKLFVRPGPASSSHQAVIEMSWPDGVVERRLLKQSLVVLDDLSCKPGALSFVGNERHRDCEITYRYRATRMLDVASPVLADLPGCLAACPGIVREHLHIGDDVWEVTWVVRIEMAGATVEPMQRHQRPHFASCRVPSKVSGRSILIPITIRASGSALNP